MTDPLELVSGYLDRDLSDDEVVELEAWILADPEHVAIFARRATVHSQIRDALAGEVSLRLSQLRSPELFEPIEGADDIDRPAEAPNSLSDAMIMQALVEPDATDERALVEPDATDERALVESDAADKLAPIKLPPGEPSAEAHGRHRLRFLRGSRVRLAAAAAAIIVLCLGLLAWRISSRPVATLTASAGSVWNQGEAAPSLGEALRRQRTLRLTQGFAELTYPSGAKVVVEAPATFVLNSRDHLTLLVGRLTALIPTPAHGFTVSTPAGEIVDLGTEFGVNVISDSLVATHVFQGRVQVQAKGDASAAPLTLTAGQGAHLADAGVSVDSTSATPEQYVRDIRQAVGRFPTHGTGEGLAEDAQDPYWQVTAIPNDPLWQAQPARVAHPLDFYIANDSSAAWISTAADLEGVDEGQYTFTTSFDLSGFNPSSAQLHLTISADDNVAEIRLNGTAVPMEKTADEHWLSSKYPVDIGSGFVPGVNRLEIIVYNFPESQLALKAELDGTAVRNVDAQ